MYCKVSEIDGFISFLFCAAPIRAYRQPRERFVVDTDASNLGIGGLLSQVKDGQERVIAYHSKMLKKAQRNYCVI
jgi:hypothetical protein